MDMRLGQGVDDWGIIFPFNIMTSPYTWVGDHLKQVDITKHELVPKHILLNDKEKEELFKKYGINLRQLPRISLTDPVIKTLDGKPGNVVKIIRKSSTAGETLYYRVITKKWFHERRFLNIIRHICQTGRFC